MVASAVAAAASPLFSGAFRYGFEYDSYLWRGFGMFTQAWAVHLSFIALACVYRVVNKGTGYILAMVALSVLLMSHLIYAYMMAITVILVVIVGARRSTIVPRLTRLAIVGVVVLAVTAFQWLPFITSRQFLSITPYLEQYKFDSFGAPAILGWLFTGDLFDHGRLPVLTFLLALGIGVAVVRRTRLNIFVLTGFLVWLVLYFGRPTLGPLFDLFPLSDGLLIHRFIGEMELFAVPLMGLGGALIWELVERSTTAGRERLGRGASWRPLVAAAVLIAILVPALAERTTFYAENTLFMETADSAIEADDGLAAIVSTLKSYPTGGRVYAGLREDWGKRARARQPQRPRRPHLQRHRRGRSSLSGPVAELVAPLVVPRPGGVAIRPGRRALCHHAGAPRGARLLPPDPAVRKVRAVRGPDVGGRQVRRHRESPAEGHAERLVRRQRGLVPKRPTTARIGSSTGTT